jgi:type I restriction enzyme S subunit
MMSRLVPKLRFKEFSGEWKERKLGDVGNTFNGLTGKTKEDFGIGTISLFAVLKISLIKT